MNYFNSLPEITSLIFICQISVPDESLIKKFGINQNSMFTLKDHDQKGHLQKLEHTSI